MLHTSHTIRSATSADGTVLLDVRCGRMFAVNATGGRILELIEQGLELPRITEEIAQNYGITLELARVDVNDFIAALQKHQILQTDVSRDAK